MKAYFEAAPHQVRSWVLDHEGDPAACSTVGLVATLRAPKLSAALVATSIERSWKQHAELRSRLEKQPGFAVPLLVVEDTACPLIRIFDGPVAREDRFSFHDQRLRESTASGEASQGGALVCSLPDGAVRVSLHHRADAMDPDSLISVLRDVVHRLGGIDGVDSLPFVDVAGWLCGEMRPCETDVPDSWRAHASMDCKLEVDREKLEAALPGISLESALLAAWVATCLRFRHPSALCLENIASLRSAVGPGAVLGAYRVPCLQDVSVDETTTFRELARHLDPGVRDPMSVAGTKLADRPSAVAFTYAGAPTQIAAGSAIARVDALSIAPLRHSMALSCVHIGELNASIHYDPRTIDAADVATTAASLRTVLAAGVAEPDHPVLTLPLAHEAGTTVARLNGPTHDQQPGFADRFAQVVRFTPDRAALRCESNSWSYAQLDAAADAVAARLDAAGLKRGDTVALLVRRSPAFVACALGALKAGVPFLPLDIAAPSSRLQFMLDDSGAKLVLAEAAFGDPPAFAGYKVLTVDDGLFRQESQPFPSTGCAPEDIAYVLYTSGSTGNPKGVELTHRGLDNYLQYAARAYDLAAGRGAIVQSPVTFDLTITALFAPLTVGQLVILVPESESVRSTGACIERVRAEIQAGDITLLKATPSYLKLLNAALSHRMGDGCVHSLVIGGEILTWDVIEPWLRGSPRTRIFNEYGPTETVVGSICHEVQGNENRGVSVPIGKPIDNTFVLVVDERGEPLPFEAFGEICIGGSGVGHGYRGLPSLTAAAFVPDCSGGQASGRIYRTGDRGRLRRSGVVELVGRTDSQLKVNGVRVEPGEIEALLLSRPSVADCGVVKGQRGDAGECLVAFVVPRSGATPDPHQLREFLADRLPIATVPSQFILMESLPLSRNGKLDRAALTGQVPRMEGVIRRTPRGARPASPAEVTLEEIWCRVLGLSAVDLDDDFFDVGGDSIRSIAVVGDARASHLDLTVADVFGLRTIRALAAHCAGRAVSPSTPTPQFALVGAADRDRMPAGIVDAYPLAALQLAMIYHNDLGAEASIYHDIFSYHLRLVPDFDRLMEASRELVRRHELLRTTFHLAGFQQPLQLVHGAGVDVLEIADLQQLTQAAQDGAVTAYMESEKSRRLDVTRLPLLRLMVHRRTHDTLQLTMSFHHALIDGWSDVVLLTELFEIYAALAASRPLATAPASRYVDFVQLERQALADPAQRAFWESVLKALCPVALPRSVDHPSVPGRVRVCQIGVPAVAVSARLKRLAADRSLPLKSLLVGIHLKVIALLSGQEGCTTAIVTNGRPETRDGDGVVGLFINSLPLHVHVAGGTWLDLARGGLDQERRFQPYRRFPFAELKTMAGERHLSESLFYFTDYYIARRINAAGVGLLDFRGHEASSFKLVANFWIDPFTEEVNASVAADPSVISDAHLTCIAGYYERALALMAESPDAPHDAQSLLSPSEAGVSPQALPNIAAAPVDQRIFERARARPEAVALVDGDLQLTYGELAERAAACDKRLRAHGLRAGDRVAVCADLSIDLVVALLAIIRCGGVYVPLATSQPAARLRLMIEDSNPSVVIVGRDWRHLVPPSAAQADLETLAHQHDGADDACAPGSRADGLAYIAYTSGTTGSPKGVAVSHRSLSNFCDAINPHLRRQAPGVWLAATTIGFDVSMLELLWTLVEGYRVVLCRGLGAGDPGRGPLAGNLAALVHAHQVTHFQCTPGVLRELVSHGSARKALASLEVLLVGGERLPAQLADWLRMHGPPRVLHLYGPTEATIWASVEALGAETPTLGRALESSRLYVLDARGQPAPYFVAGELYVGGMCLADGYWNNPKLTSESFITSPIRGHEGALLYRTGDMARQLPDGRFEFLGRMDRQIKRWGHRIELEEIERVLLAHDGVVDCAVVELGGNLTAAVVHAPGASIPLRELRSFASAHLPFAMVPTGFVLFERLPQTPNGKLDEALVHQMACEDGAPAEVEQESAREPDAVEARISACWKSALHALPSSLSTDFFRAGGNSLSAMVFAATLREEFDMGVSVRHVFENPTVRELAIFLRAGGSPPPESANRSTTQPARQLGFSETRLWTHAQMTPGSLAYNYATLVELAGALSRSRLEGAIVAVMQRHEAMRTLFIATDGVPAALAGEGPGFDFEVVDMGGRPADESREASRQLLLEAARKEFDLERGPLARFVLVGIDASTHLLLVVAHHIACDGWSMAVLLKEIAQKYSHPEQELPRLQLAYSAFVQREQARWTPEHQDRVLGYWREHMRDMPEPYELPLDFSRPAQEAAEGAITRVMVPLGTTFALEGLAISERATLFMVLLAAVTIVLTRFSARSDIVIGADMANRDTVDTLDMVGLLVNQLPVRLDTSAATTFQDFLAQVRQRVLGALANKDLPFQRLVKEVAQARAPSRHPIYQIAFTLQESPDFAAVSPRGLELKEVPIDIGVARLDLELGARRLTHGTELSATYRSDLYTRHTIDRVLQAILRILDAIVTEPGLPLERLPLLPPGDSGSSGVACSPEPVWDGPRSFNELFASAVARTPDAVAAIAPSGVLSYRELDVSAHRLALRMARSGVSAGNVIAVLAERDSGLLVGMLATWKAGAIYLPLDPHSPGRRVGHFIVEAGCSHVLYSRSCARLLDSAQASIQPPGARPILIQVEPDAEPGANDPPANTIGSKVPGAPQAEDTPAYVIFTSGSTGNPKAAVVLHRGMMNHLYAKVSDLGLKPRDRVAQTAPQTFDISIWQMIAPLAVGASVRIYSDEDSRNPPVFLEAADRDGITVIQLVPSFLEGVVLAAESLGAMSTFRHLRWMISTGEALTVGLCRRWLERFPSIPLMNAYGPAECSDDVTHHIVTTMPALDATSVPIGKPIRNVGVHVLDHALQPVPTGAVGELCVTGVAVGAGYLNDPDATRRKFVPDPLDASARRTLYRTGDLARWQENGVLEYLGRLDNQVKIGGSRIEVEEIEATLNADSLVCQSIVVATSGQQRKLIAYVKPDWSAVEASETPPPRHLRTAEWMAIYDHYYEETFSSPAQAGQPVSDPTFDTTGWVDSFTLRPIGNDSMWGWLNQTVERILALGPRRVLEIGCGTGMLLYRVAPHCARYRALDLSQAVVDRVQTTLARQFPSWTHVSVECRPAHDLPRVEEGGFDCVILNSVVQYFPGEDYLREVLRQVGERLAPGGVIFLGDVRALEALDGFHAAVQIASCAPNLPCAEVRLRLQLAKRQEKELLLSNRFFDEVAADLGGPIRSFAVRKWLKAGPHDNEMVRYRLDVALAADCADCATPPTLTWTEAGQSVHLIVDILDERGWDSLVVTGIPNDRLRLERSLLKMLATEGQDLDAGAVLQSARTDADASGVCPDQFIADLHRAGYYVQTCFSDPADQCSFDAFVSSTLQAWPRRDSRDRVTSNNPQQNRLEPLLQRRLRGRLNERLPAVMVPGAFVFVDEFPLLSSGKINRRALSTTWFGMDVLAGDAPRTFAERVLCEVWKDLLRVQNVGIRSNFFELGGDSILAIQMVALARRQTLTMQTRDVFRHPTIAELASVTKRAGDRTDTVDEGPLAGPCPLAPIQTAFFELGLANANHWNQAIMLECKAPIGESGLANALRAVVERHDALRMRFFGAGASATQECVAMKDMGAPELLVVATPTDEAMAAAAQRLHGAMSVCDPPLLKAAYQPGSASRTSRLLLVAHHLVVDAFSWGVIVEDLAVLLDFGPAALASRTASYRDWVERQIALAETDLLREQWPYWLTQVRESPAYPVSATSNPLRPQKLEEVLNQIIPAPISVQLMQDRAREAGLRLEEVLLVALALALSRRFGRTDTVILNEGHGRDHFDDLDVSRTVGWFTSAYPVLFRINAKTPIEVQVQSLLQQLRRAKAQQLGFGVLKYLSPDALVRRSLAETPPTDVSFNFFGNLALPRRSGNRFRFLPGEAGNIRDHRDRLPCAVHIDAWVSDDTLVVHWTIDSARQDRQAIDALAADLEDQLQLLSHMSPRAWDAQASLHDSIRGDDLAGAISEVGL